MLPFIRLLATAVLLWAFALDVIGRMTSHAVLWSLGGHTATAGLLLGVLIWLAGWFRKPATGQLSWMFALAAFGLARFLRGSAGVPPDVPLLWLSGFGSLLLGVSWWQRRRATNRSQSHAAAAPPA